MIRITFDSQRIRKMLRSMNACAVIRPRDIAALLAYDGFAAGGGSKSPCVTRTYRGGTTMADTLALVHVRRAILRAHDNAMNDGWTEEDFGARFRRAIRDTHPALRFWHRH